VKLCKIISRINDIFKNTSVLFGEKKKGGGAEREEKTTDLSTFTKCIPYDFTGIYNSHLILCF
jgi:hypothetical protein